MIPMSFTLSVTLYMYISVHNNYSYNCLHLLPSLSLPKLTMSDNVPTSMFPNLLSTRTKLKATLKSTQPNTPPITNTITHYLFSLYRLGSTPTNTKIRNPFPPTTPSSPLKAFSNKLRLTLKAILLHSPSLSITLIFLTEQHYLQLCLELFVRCCSHFPIHFTKSTFFVASPTISHSSHFKFNFELCSPSLETLPTPSSTPEPSISQSNVGTSTRRGKRKKDTDIALKS